MKYLNQFHKESSQRKQAQVEQWRKNPVPSSEASKKQFEMHKRIAETYPNQIDKKG